MALTSSALNDDFKRHSLLILQSSLAQSSLPILHSLLVGDEKKQRRNVLFCLLYPPNVLIDPTASDEVYNWLDRVPGYNNANTQAEILATTEKGASEKITLQPSTNLKHISFTGSFVFCQHYYRFRRYASSKYRRSFRYL
jgi:hypothetical protein